MNGDWAGHLTRDVLPWWEHHGSDDAAGGVRTGFDNSGVLHTRDRFTWSQGRWAWLAAELAEEAEDGRLRVDQNVWRARCLLTCERILRDAQRPDGRTHFRVTEDNAAPVLDETGESATSVFADLFAVLGLAGGLRMLPEEDPRRSNWCAAARSILFTAHRSMADRTAITEPYPVPAQFRDMAGPMTLLHTAAELLRAGLDQPTRQAARAARDWAARQLRTTHLTTDGWREFAPVMADDEDSLLARHRTPGHLLELVWMIQHAQQQDPTFNLLSHGALAHLAEQAITIGWDDVHGGILRYVDHRGGEPRGRRTGGHYEELVQRTWSTKLWWVHVEALYAMHLLAPQASSGDLRGWADKVADWTMSIFPDQAGNEWIQIRDRTGQPLNEVVALPVKDPFHIVRALIFMNRLAIGAAPERTSHGSA